METAIVECLFTLFAGIGVFITGMNLMGEGLEKSSGEGMKRIFRKVGNNPFINVGAGAVVTGIIQSSAATTVMAMGFVNAKVMSLLQATYIVMGAAIGTTVTGLIVSLQSLPIADIISLFAFVGVMMMFIKKESVKRIGQILCGFGLIFVGLSIMKGSFDDPIVKQAFAEIFVSIKVPLLLVIVGALFTALIQSSSTTTGLLVIMVSGGAMDLATALYVVVGANIGTCITALIAATGATPNAKRTAVIHLLIKMFGGVVFYIILALFKDPVCVFLGSLVADLGMQLAFFHLFFNVINTIILLPFARFITDLSCKIVKDKKTEQNLFKNKYIDDRLIQTPPIAVQQTKCEVEYMASIAQENFKLAFNGLVDKSVENAEIIDKNEDILDFTNTSLTHYLIKLGPVISGNDETMIGSFFHVVNDIERIGDHAENFLDITKRMIEEELEFSGEAKEELKAMYGKIEQMFEIAMNVFDKKDKQHLNDIALLEDEVDALKEKLSAGHIARMAQGVCSVEVGAYFYSLVSGLERVADHLVNIAYSIVNPTGKVEQIEQ